MAMLRLITTSKALRSRWLGATPGAGATLESPGVGGGSRGSARALPARRGEPTRQPLEARVGRLGAKARGGRTSNQPELCLRMHLSRTWPSRERLATAACSWLVDGGCTGLALDSRPPSAHAATEPP